MKNPYVKQWLEETRELGQEISAIYAGDGDEGELEALEARMRVLQEKNPTFSAGAAAFRQLNELAEQGNGPAQAELGMYFLSGDEPDFAGEVTPRNLHTAIRWLRRAASNTEPRAQYHLGKLTAAGDGVEQDDVEATNWFLAAAQQEHTQSQHATGTRYLSGLGVAKSETIAFGWFLRAANKGHALAQFAVGVCCRNGTGTPTDFKAAEAWFRKAAAQGLPKAQFNLALMCIAGLSSGSEVDPRWTPDPTDDCPFPERFTTEAEFWLRLAAQNGHAGACFKLSSFYDCNAEKLFFLEEAHACGYGDCRGQIAELAGRLSNEETARFKGIKYSRGHHLIGGGHIKIRS